MTWPAMTRSAPTWPLHPVRNDVRVRVARAMPPLSPALDARVSALWDEACTRHALFNGRVFSVDGIAPDVITGHWSEYRRVVAQMRDPALKAELGVRNLAVSGVIAGPDGVLLGRRASNAVYQPGMWQLPPAGSVDGGAATADGADLRMALWAELREELGLGPDAVDGFRPLCLVEHPDSGVIDLGIALRTGLGFAALQAAHAACGDAEYERLMCDARLHLVERVRGLGDEIVPPALAFLAAL